MEKRKLNNEGFSLIELIIVIAIMAILVGALAPQLIKYIERSRQANDIQKVSAVQQAILTAMLDPQNNYTAPNTTPTYANLAAVYSDGNTKFTDSVKEILGETDASKLGFESKAFKGQPIVVQITTSKVTCTVESKQEDGKPLADKIEIPKPATVSGDGT